MSNLEFTHPPRRFRTGEVLGFIRRAGLSLMRSAATLGLAGLGIASLGAATTSDDFGTGTNEFSTVFVDIGDPGNAPDPLAHLAVDGWTNNPPDGVLLGAVNYPYRIGKYEVPTFRWIGETAWMAC